MYISGVIFIYIWVRFIYMALIYIYSPDLHMCVGYIIYMHQIYIYEPYICTMVKLYIKGKSTSTIPKYSKQSF